LTLNHVTYNAGRKIDVSTVATSKPPMMAKAIGPQKMVVIFVWRIVAKIRSRRPKKE